MACRLGIFVGVALAVASTAAAQDRASRYVSTGVVDFGGRPRLFLGGGGERQIASGPSIGGEAALVLDEDRQRLTLVSLTAGRTFAPSGARLQPFVRGGLTLVGASFGWTAGGGASFWLAERTGLRCEARVLAPLGGEGGAYLATIGVTFR